MRSRSEQDMVGGQVSEIAAVSVAAGSWAAVRAGQHFPRRDDANRLRHTLSWLGSPSDYWLEVSTGAWEPLPDAALRLGRRTVLTFPLLPPPQKN